MPPNTRGAVLVRIVDLAGTASAKVVDARNGWPGVVRVATPQGVVEASAHVSRVGSMSRKPEEIRFQNPSQQAPMQLVTGTELPLLLGLDDGSEPIIVAADAVRRLGKTTRFSVRFPDSLVAEARARGWAEFDSSSGERIYAFHPALLAAYVEMQKAQVHLNPSLVAAAVSGAGLLDTDDDAAHERARRSTSALVRNARFGRDVVAAYGQMCALCDLGLGLVAGAHVYPVSAPGSPDKVWNGIALCHNHHAAFDRHLIHIDPTTLNVSFEPSVIALTHTDVATAHFVQTTRAVARQPRFPSARIRSEMLTKRYEFYKGNYDWV